MPATLIKKALTGVRIKDATQGIVELAFATFDKIDKDGDVTLKGAFEDGAAVVLSAYGHSSWTGELPLGHGTIHETAKEAVADVQFLLETTHGRDAFLTVEALSAKGLQEWSYSLENVEYERGEFEGKSVRFLKKITVKEVSPVLRGVGDTRTLDVKQQKQLTSMIARMLDEAGSSRFGGEYGYCYLEDFDIDKSFAVFCVIDYSMGERERYHIQVDYARTDTSVTLGDVETLVEYTTVYLPKGTKFSEHAAKVLADVDALIARASEVMALRAEKGKTLSDESSAQLKALRDRLDELVAEIPPEFNRDELDRIFLRLVASS